MVLFAHTKPTKPIKEAFLLRKGKLCKWDATKKQYVKFKKSGVDV